MGLSAWSGVCAALLPPEHGGPDPGPLARRVCAHLERVPPRLRAAFNSGAVAVDGFALTTTRRRLSQLDPGRRAAVLDRLDRLSAESGHAVQALKALVLFVAGAHAYQPHMAARAAGDGLAQPDAVMDVTPAGQWPSRTSADVVVIGSGAGGAMAARTLARRGLHVVVAEEGRRFSVEEFRERHLLERFADLYRDAGATGTIGRPPILLPIGRGVGGTTLVNSGTCYRTPDRVLRRWSNASGLELADPDRFAPLLDEVESTLGVAAVPEAVMGANGRLLLEGAVALGWASGPLQRNAPGCGGCCQCSVGCPRNAKAGVHLNALPQACAAGARILSEARVVRVLHEAGCARGVLARRGDGSLLTVFAPRVIVAAGATETPMLLRRSGLGRHPRLGRNLALHPAIGVAGRFDHPVTAWDGVLQSAAVEEFHERDGILIEATATPPGMGSATLPGFGPELVAGLAGADHLAMVGAMVADAPSGAVLGAGRRQMLVRYDLAPADARRLLAAVSAMGRLLLAAGAREVLTGLHGAPPARDTGTLDEIVRGADPRRLHLAAFHPTGTAAAGNDPQRHPVDAGGRLRGIDGLWVADASVLPSSPEVNPQVSIMALALAVADGVR